MDAHKFTPATGAKNKCDVCGKTRNAVAHRGVKATTTNAQKAKQLTQQIREEKAAQVKLWVGWRIAHEAILQVGDKDPVVASLAVKLRDAKPDAVLDRRVQLTRAECDALDAIAAVFELKGNTGPAIYSARTLRKRLAAAWQ